MTHRIRNQPFSSGVLFLFATLFLQGGCRQSTDTPLAENPPESAKEASANTPESLIQQLNQRVRQKDFDAAEGMLRQLMMLDPKNIDYIKTAAFIKGRRGQPGKAAAILNDAIINGIQDDEMITLAIRANMEVGRFFETIDLLREVVRVRPGHAGYRRMLIGFLGEGQLMNEVPEHLLALIKTREFDALLLETVVLTGRRFSVDPLAKLFERNPQDLRLNVAEAVSMMDAAKFSQAIPLLTPMTRQHQDFDLGWSLLARCFAMTGNYDQLDRLVSQIPDDFHPDADWDFARGRLHQHHGRLDLAIASTWSAVEKQPNDAHSLTELTSLLVKWRESEKSLGLHESLDRTMAVLVRRRTLLADLLHRATAFSYGGHTERKKATAIASTLLDLGRIWEAEAWSAIALTLKSSDDATRLPDSSESQLISPADLRAQILRSMVASTPWQTPVTQLLPPPSVLRSHWGELPPERHADPSPIQGFPPTNLRFSFQNQADQYGVHYTGHTGPQRFGPMVPLSDSLGCGLGLLDYDLDGHLDIFMAAAGGSVHGHDSAVGAMLRRIDDQFSDVTSFSGGGDNGFGQGVAIADFNQDGFADLYLLNFGVNRCFQNNGDGTFTDVTQATGLAGVPAWSASGAWVDLNADGYLDLVVCNYIDDGAKVTEVCRDAQGAPAPCSPLHFPPARNQFYAGTAQGHWVDVTDRWLDEPVHGRSLGILAGRLDGHHQAVFVANDMTSNAYLVATTENNEDDCFRLAEQSFLSGLAVDGRGRTQASMGMAAEDFDNDGDLDFYITGFADEYNVLYRQESPGVWSDQTSLSGLVSPTLNRVGFGTKAIDLDNNGSFELFVANGHVSGGEPGEAKYAQTVDLFVPSGPGRYVRTNVDAPDDYWTQPHVGRCVIPLDVDLDGRQDLLVTHMTEKPALLHNQTQTDYQSSTVEVIGTTGTRNPVGTIITVTFQTEHGQRIQRRQVLAGNGYLISPQPAIRFTFADHEMAMSTEIEWPDGTKQRVRPLRAGKRYLCVQGQALYDYQDLQ